ncbi:MAG: MgtC/SapB family protein [Clostridia bacterium]|nr:MgtC/SapB family protein [Clostridia bacterium]
MDAFIEYLRDFNIVTIIVRLVLAALFGGVIGLERGRQRRAAGLRTHILVCIGAALTATVGFFARDVLGTVGADPLRISAQVISGIGFLGVGTILLKGRFQITGLTTAAGLWVTAAIGIALGAGFYEGALVAFLVTVITVMLLHKIERTVNDHHSSFGVYVELKGDASVRECVELLKEKYRAHDIQVTLPRSGTSGNVGIEASISSSRTQKVELDETLAYLDTLDYVVFAIESI